MQQKLHKRREMYHQLLITDYSRIGIAEKTTAEFAPHLQAQYSRNTIFCLTQRHNSFTTSNFSLFNFFLTAAIYLPSAMANFIKAPALEPYAEEWLAVSVQELSAF
jgi:hypothetical protein